MTVARNTIVNARQALVFEDADCMVFAPILDFDHNLIMNQSAGTSLNGHATGAGRRRLSTTTWRMAGIAPA